MMILNLLHDRHSLTEVACIKRAIEDSYGLYGVQVYDRGYFYVPFKGPMLDASEMLKYMVGVLLGPEMRLWVVDDELFYPGKGAIFGCSTGKSAVLSRSGMDQAILAKEAIHEVGHVLGLNHCHENCVMNLSKSKEEVGKKSSSLCTSCSTRLLIRVAADSEFSR
jgi:archaemetzincin